MTFLFAGEHGSRPMGMATALSDDDIYAVHETPETSRIAFTLESPDGRVCDVLSWHVEKISAPQRRAFTRFPSYHHRLQIESVARRCCAPEDPDDHVTELLLSRRVWDDRHYMSTAWPAIRAVHLDRLKVLDLLYAKARGLWEHVLQGQEIPVRRYLNAVHRVLGMRWILAHGSVPPIEFDMLLQSCDERGVTQTSSLLLRTYKASGLDKSMALVAPTPLLHDYLAHQLDELEIAIGALAECEPNHPLNVR